MELYYAPGACSLAPHIVAREAGLPLALVRVDLATRRTEDGRDFKVINPKGYVPALGLPDDGGVLAEAAAILQYLVDQAPDAGLAPRFGTLERYRFVEWLTFVSSEIHKGFGPLWNPATPDAVRQAAVEKLGTRFAHLDAHLAGNAYLLGEAYSAADAYLFTVMGWAAYHKVDISAHPNLRAYLGRIAARPAVQAAMRAEGLLRDAA